MVYRIIINGRARWTGPRKVAGKRLGPGAEGGLARRFADYRAALFYTPPTRGIPRAHRLCGGAF